MLRKETLSVGFACALGAFIGAFVALEIATRFAYGSWFWGIGALVGGLVAYCAVDFRHFCAGIANSYHKTIVWRPHVEWWKTYLMCACTIAMLFTSAMVVALFFSLLSDEEFHGPSTGGSISIAVLIGLLALVFGREYVPSYNKYSDTTETYHQKLLIVRRQATRQVFHLSPIGLIYNLARGLSFVSTLFWTNKMKMVRGIAAAVSFTVLKVKQFAVDAFHYVHSERRKICFVDAALGATAGYFLGSAIAGAMIGAILGVVNYEVVSVRWLKIVPAKAK